MNSSTFLESIECALSSHLRHISLNPISLSCGHTICKECLDSSLEEKIFCVHCKTSQTKPYGQRVSLSAKVVFDTFKDKTFEYLLDKFGCAVRGLKENCFEENLNLRMSLLKNDIDVRVESLKCELDTIREKLFERLDKIEQQIIINKYENYSHNDTLKKFETAYHELKEYNNSTKNKTEDKFKVFQTSLKSLHEINENLLKDDFKLNFDTSKFSFEDRNIGYINFTASWQIDSKIILKDEFMSLIKLLEFEKRSEWKLLYRGSRDGFKSRDFHTKCDGIASTLTIIKSSNNSVFGGYTSVAWASSGKFCVDKNAFVFSFKNHIQRIFKSKVNMINFAVYCCSSYGPIFGGSDQTNRYYNHGYNYNQNIMISDIFIADSCNLGSISNCQFTDAYNQYPRGLSCLNGNESGFSVVEIEVFEI